MERSVHRAVAGKGVMHAVQELIHAAVALPQRKFLVLSLVLALVTRLAVVLLVQPQPISDFAWYYARAIAIGENQGYVLDDGTPTAFWPVGYPAFLGGVFRVFGASIQSGELANAIVSTATIVIFYLIAVRLTDSTLVARLATLAVIFWPNQIAYCALLSDTVLFQFLLYASVLALLWTRRGVMLVPAGVLVGLTALVRPYGILIPLVFVVLRLRREPMPHLARILVLSYGGAIVVLAPWTIRNYDLFGAFVFVSTNGGQTLLIGNNPHANGTYVEEESDALTSGSGVAAEYTRDQETRKLALNYISQNPIRTLAMVGPKLFYQFAEDADGLRWILKGTRPSEDGLVPDTGPTNYGAGLTRYQPWDYVGMAVFQLYYLAVMVGFIGYFLLRPRHSEVQPIDILALGLVGYIALIGAVFIGQPRFHVPAMPAVALYAAAFAISPALRKSWWRVHQQHAPASRFA